MVGQVKTKYTVTYERDADGWWVASVRGLKGCHTQGKTISQARERVREAMEAMGVSHAGKADLVDDVRLPAAVAKGVKYTHEFSERSKEYAVKAQEALARVAAELEKIGVSRRDAAEILGISHQRVQQVTK